MSRSITKLKCFTILELIVAMLLTSIVISIAYAGLRLTAGYIRSFSENNSNTSEFIKLNRAMQLDFQKSDAITLTEDGAFCRIKDEPISYDFLESRIVRRGNEIAADTFYLDILDKQIKYDSATQDSIGGLIDQLSLALVIKKDTFHLKMNKEYDAQFLFNHSFILNSWQE